MNMKRLLKMNDQLPSDVWFVRIGQCYNYYNWVFLQLWQLLCPIYNYLKVLNLRVQKIYIYIENIAFKVVSIMSLAVHIIDKKISFHICVVGNVLNTFMEHNIYLIS